MRVESLACPKCGAPLHLEAGQALIVCLYCNSMVRAVGTPPVGTPPVGTPAPANAPAPLEVERELPEADLEAVKKMLAAGQRAEALAAYQRLTGAEAAEAQATLDQLGRQLTAATLLRQMLSPFGVGIVLASLAGLGVAVGGAAAGWLDIWLALGLGAFALFQLAVAARATVNTLRYLSAPVAEAVTLKLAPIGVFERAGGDIHAFRVWLEVRPAGEAPFRAEIQLPVRESNLARAREGAVLRVKYFPGDPASVIFFEKS